MSGQMTLFDIGLTKNEWQYDEDNGHVMCRCPKCEGRLIIDAYTYFNPYRYCPYCGMELAEGNLVRKRCEVYGRTKEDELKTRADILQWKKEFKAKYGYHKPPAALHQRQN